MMLGFFSALQNYFFFCLAELKKASSIFKTELSWLWAVLRKKKIDTDEIEIIILYQPQINFTSGFPLELSFPSIFQQNISRIVPMTQTKHFSQDEFLCCRSSFIPKQTPAKTWARLVRWCGNICKAKDEIGSMQVSPLPTTPPFFTFIQGE